MVKTLANEIFKEMKLRQLMDTFKREDKNGNKSILEGHLIEINITKCSMSDLDINEPGELHYLQYLLQSEGGINFGICEFYKVWKNKEGWQYGCYFDKGKGKRIQVGCDGFQNQCVRTEDLSAFKYI